MGNTVEPLRTPKGKACIAVVVVMFLMALPWYNAPYSTQAIQSGMPSWAVIFLSAYIVAIVILVYAFSLWETEEDDAEDGFVPVVPRQSVTTLEQSDDAAALVGNNSEA